MPQKERVKVLDSFHGVQISRSKDGCSSPIGCWAFGLEAIEEQGIVMWLSKKAAIDLAELLMAALDRVDEREEMN